MSPLNEAKTFVGLHAQHMGLDAAFVESVLARIERLEGEGAGSWVDVWTDEAEGCSLGADYVGAANRYNLARFPVANSPARKLAAQLAASEFAEAMRHARTGERRVARVGEIEVPFLFAAGARADCPLVILMGGIVSLKEQWGGFLSLGRRLGCAIAIADFPGVGENRLVYRREAAQLFGAIMDGCRGASDESRALVVAPSFGGHLALLASLGDRRIREIVTVGAPIAHFFRESAGGRAIPAITRMALEHSTAAEGPQLAARLFSLAMSPREIASITVPVTYVASLRDEIIPGEDFRDASTLNPRFKVFAFDDVHGSPHHLRYTRALILGALLRHVGRVRIARWLTRAVQLALQIRPLRSRPSFA